MPYTHVIYLCTISSLLEELAAMAKILVVEDDPDVNRTICTALTYEHHTVESVLDGADALARLKAYNYDVVVVDWQLPGLTGLEVCREYRTTGGKALMIMLTGRSKLTEKEEGLDAGYDDYLVKPFDVRELVARIRALLRRASSRITGNILEIGKVKLEPNTYRVTRAGKEIKLVPKEFAILEFLMRHPNIVFSCEALMSRVWTAEEESSPEIIRTHIKNLRKKLDISGEPELISTVHGVGYRLVEPASASS